MDIGKGASWTTQHWRLEGLEASEAPGTDFQWEGQTNHDMSKRHGGILEGRPQKAGGEQNLTRVTTTARMRQIAAPDYRIKCSIGEG